MKKKAIKKFGMPPKEITLPIFSPGKQINHEGKTYTIDYVRVRGYDLLVKFKELNQEVNSEDIPCEYTVFVL